jgi:hypothetical protein
MKVSAVTWLSWRWLLGLGPRQTICPGSISDRNVNDGLPVQEPVVAPEVFSSTASSRTSIPKKDGLTISSVIYPNKHLIFINNKAEDSPTRTKKRAAFPVESV